MMTLSERISIERVRASMAGLEAVVVNSSSNWCLGIAQRSYRKKVVIQYLPCQFSSKENYS